MIFSCGRHSSHRQSAVSEKVSSIHPMHPLPTVNIDAYGLICVNPSRIYFGFDLSNRLRPSTSGLCCPVVPLRVRQAGMVISVNMIRFGIAVADTLLSRMLVLTPEDWVIPNPCATETWGKIIDSFTENTPLGLITTCFKVGTGVIETVRKYIINSLLGTAGGFDGHDQHSSHALQYDSSRAVTQSKCSESVMRSSI